MTIENIFEYTIYSDAFSARVCKDGKIIKRFKGETAWSDAELWAWDAHYAQ